MIDWEVASAWQPRASYLGKSGDKSDYWSRTKKRAKQNLFLTNASIFYTEPEILANKMKYLLL